MKKILTLALAVLMVFSLVACTGDGANNSNSYTANNTEFVIGGTGPLTGDASSYGISVQEGATIAIEQINANGGLNGVNFKLDMKDDKAQATDAATGYDMLYEAGMNVSIGSVTSGSCAAFAEKAAQDNLFFITPSASAANVIEAPNAFRICFGDPQQGEVAATELQKNGFTNIGCIYDTSDPYSYGIYEAFDAKMKELEIDYTVQSFDAENKKDFSTQIEALKDCDVIFCPFYYTEGGLVARAAAAKGCDALIFGCDGFDGIADQIDDTVTNEIKYITPFDVNSEDAVVASFVESYKAKYNKEPDQFAADGYDAVMVIFEALKKAEITDPTTDPATICDKLIEVVTGDFEFVGATGTMTWDKSGSCEKLPAIVNLEK